MGTLLSSPSLGAAGQAAYARRRLSASRRNYTKARTRDSEAGASEDEDNEETTTAELASAAAGEAADKAAAVERAEADIKFAELAARFHEWNLDVFDVFDLTPTPLVKVRYGMDTMLKNAHIFSRSHWHDTCHVLFDIFVYGLSLLLIYLQLYLDVSSNLTLSWFQIICIILFEGRLRHARCFQSRCASRSPQARVLPAGSFR